MYPHPHWRQRRPRLRASGGTIFFSTSDQTNGVVLGAGTGTWSSLSDRNAKENFAPVDGLEVLERLAAIPVETWNYKTQDDAIRHMGPMAQDFAAAFGLGADEKRITTIDADGVALAAIQGLHQLAKAKDKELAVQRRQNVELLEHIGRLELDLRDQRNEVEALQARLEAIESLISTGRKTSK